MSVSKFRIIAEEPSQPLEFNFSSENLAKAKKIIKMYPSNFKESSIMPLLSMAQEQNHGWLPKKAIEYVSDDLILIGGHYPHGFIQIYDLADRRSIEIFDYGLSEVLDFQINDIESVAPPTAAALALSKDFNWLKNIEDTISTLKNINLTLNESDHSIYKQLSSAISNFPFFCL